MSDIRSEYPAFDHFLQTELYQDAEELDLVQVVRHYANQYERGRAEEVLKDLQGFLRNYHNDIDSAFEGFKPQIYPPGYGLTTREWLEEVSRQFVVAMKPVSTNRLSNDP